MPEISDLPPFLIKRISVSDTGCWRLFGASTRGGYGKTKYKRRTWLGHRLVYTLLVGEIADGLTLDHLCRVRCCCNPAHLEPVTHRVNIMRGEGKAPRNIAKTTCTKGHELSGDNLYRTNGRRRCRECNRVNALARYHRNRANGLCGCGNEPARGSAKCRRCDEYQSEYRNNDHH